MENKKEPQLNSAFWFAVAFIVIGSLMILNNFGIIQYGVWETIWKLWPLLFIVFGVALLSKRR